MYIASVINPFYSRRNQINYQNGPNSKGIVQHMINTNINKQTAKINHNTLYNRNDRSRVIMSAMNANNHNQETIDINDEPVYDDHHHNNQNDISDSEYVEELKVKLNGGAISLVVGYQDEESRIISRVIHYLNQRKQVQSSLREQRKEIQKEITSKIGQLLF